MEKKNLIIIGVVVLIIAVLGILFVTNVFNVNGAQTPFDTEFMSGTFSGNVEKKELNESYIASYHDNQNNITYNLTTMDNSSALMEIYKFQGVLGPEYRSYNGNNWSIYFGEAMPVVNNSVNVSANNSMGIVICEIQHESQGYVVYAIFEDLNKINFTVNTFGDSYVQYIEPLLKTINLKETENVTAVHEQFGMTKEQFDQQIQLIRLLQSGNSSSSK